MLNIRFGVSLEITPLLAVTMVRHGKDIVGNFAHVRETPNSDWKSVLTINIEELVEATGLRFENLTGNRTLGRTEFTVERVEEAIDALIVIERDRQTQE